MDSMINNLLYFDGNKQKNNKKAENTMKISPFVRLEDVSRSIAAEVNQTKVVRLNAISTKIR